jgi:hypothetical protein
MNEWMNMSTLGTMVLQEGVKFLYEHAMIALRRKLAPHADAPPAPRHLPPKARANCCVRNRLNTKRYHKTSNIAFSTVHGVVFALFVFGPRAAG